MYNGIVFLEQYLFDRCLQAFWFALKLLLKVLVYSPMIIAGYFISDWFLAKAESVIVWAGLVFLTAFLLYLFLYFIKGMIIGFISKGNFLWLPLFILSVAYACAFPVWVSFEVIHGISLLVVRRGEAITLSWIIGILLFFYIYSRYHFLMDAAPGSVYPVYKAGIHLSLSLTNPKA